MTKLRRLRIEQFRNVPAGTEIRFNDTFNVLLGQNGSGKTTLLRLISMLVRSDLSDLAEEEFHLEYEIDYAEGSVTVDLWNHLRPADARGRRRAFVSSAKVRLQISDVGHSGQIAELEGFFQDGGFCLRDIRSGATWPLGRDEDYVPTGPNFAADILFAARVVLQAEPAVVRDDYSRARRFDESLQLFDGIFQDPEGKRVWLEFSRDAQAQVNYQVPEPAEGLTPFIPEPLAKAARLACLGQTSLPEDLRVKQVDVPFLADFVRLLGLHHASLRLQLLGKAVEHQREVGHYGNLSLLLTRRDGSVFPQQHLSYGQKRLFVFLYYLAANPAVVIADELVNGMHHDWIEECIKQLGARQCFLTSQNPLLLDYLWFESLEQVRSSFLLCRSRLTDDVEQLTWSGLTEDEATMFYDAYATGIQYVSEILRTRGLW